MKKKINTTTLNPMMRSGLRADPARLMMGMNMAKVVMMRYMLRMRGTSRDTRWIRSHRRSRGRRWAGFRSYMYSKILRPE